MRGHHIRPRNRTDAVVSLSASAHIAGVVSGQTVETRRTEERPHDF